jgi:hypothetical protein
MKISRVRRNVFRVFKDVVNRAIIQIALVVTQKLHIPQKLLAIDVIQVAQVVLGCEVEKEAEAVVVRWQRLLALALLVFGLEQLKLCEPLIDSIRNSSPTGVILVLNDRHVSRASK